MTASGEGIHDPFLWDDIEVELCSTTREACSYPMVFGDDVSTPGHNDGDAEPPPLPRGWSSVHGEIASP